MHQHAAYVFVGPRTEVVKQAEEHLRRVWCPEKATCTDCFTCTSIKAHHYYLLFWLTPEKHYYTVDQMHTLTHSLSFALPKDENSYIVFDTAEMLSSSSAHTLLKVVEEPPAGYHFIFLAESLELLLPTLVSRCIIMRFDHKGEERWTEFFNFFTKPNPKSWLAFCQALDKDMPSEQETKPLLERLANHWLQAYKKATAQDSMQQATYAYTQIQHIQEMFNHPPLPGSGKIFWRTLFSRMSSSELS